MDQRFLSGDRSGKTAADLKRIYRRGGSLGRRIPGSALDGPKYEIAGELGLLERVLNDGWRSLTAKETGRIGGLVTRRKRQMAAEGKNENEEK